MASKKKPSARKPPRRQPRKAASVPPDHGLGPWEVDAATIVRLGEEVDNHVRRLLANVGVRTIKGGDDRRVGDQGVDLVVECPSYLSSSSIPAGTSHWWITSQELRSEKALERWLAKHSSKPAAAMARGSTVAVLTNCSVLAKQKKRVELEKKHGVLLRNAQDIAAWTNEFPALARRLGAAARAGTWLDYELDKHPTAFIWDDTRRKFLLKLEQRLQTGGASLRLEGFAGIGKTRVALESLREVCGGSRQHQVIYFAELSEDAKAAIRELAPRPGYGRSAIIVVDECSPEHSSWLREELQGRSNQWLLTIGIARSSSATSDAVETIDALPKEELLAFIGRTVTDQQVASFLADQCAGFIKAANELAPLVAANPNEWTHVRLTEAAKNHTLFTHALTGIAPMLELVAVFDELGWEGEFNREVEVVRSRFCTDPNSEREFELAATRARERGILQAARGLRYVSPDVLANELAIHAASSRRVRLVALFLELPQRARLSMLRRLVRLRSNKEVEELLREILGKLPPPRRGNALAAVREPVEPSEADELRAQLSEALPMEALAAISRFVEGLDSHGLRSLSRRPFVHLLENAASEPGSFRAVARTALPLAAYETEPYSNNSRGLFLELFGIGIARTDAPNEERLAFLSDASASPDEHVRLVSANALGALLRFDHAAIASPRPEREVKHRPSDALEVEGVFAKALPLLVRLACHDSNSDVREHARAELSGAIRLGVQTAPRIVLVSLETIDESPDRETRREVRRVLEALSHDKEMPHEVRDALEPWIGKLSAVGFADRLHASLDDYRFSDPNREQVIARECEALAQEAVREPALVEPERDWLIRKIPAPANAHEFWRKAGELDSENKLHRILTEEVTRGHGAYALAFYLRGAASRIGANEVEDLLDALAETVPETAAEVTWRLRASDRGLARIERLARSGSLNPHFGEVLAYWGLELGVMSLLRLITLAQEIPLPELAYGLTAIVGRAEREISEEKSREEVRSRVARLLPVLFATHHSGALHFWGPLALRDRNLVELVELLVAKFDENLSFVVIEEMARFLNDAFAQQPEVWASFVGALRRNLRLRIPFSQRFNPTEAAVRDTLMPWARATDWGPELLATVTVVGPFPLMRALLAEFGDRPEVTRSISHKHLRPGFGHQTDVQFLGERLKELESWDEIPEMTRWCRAQRAIIQRQLTERAA